MRKQSLPKVKTLIQSLRDAGVADDQILDAVLAHEEERKARRRLDVTPSEWWQLWGQIIRRDGGKCVYCGSDGNGVKLQCDHVMPKSRGGKSTLENLVAACKSCNSRKRDRTPDEWRGIQ